MACECQPPCPEGISFADFYFRKDSLLFKHPLLKFDDEWVAPFAEGHHVYVVHDGQRYQVTAHYGYFNSGVSTIVPLKPRLLTA